MPGGLEEAQARSCLIGWTELEWVTKVTVLCTVYGLLYIAHSRGPLALAETQFALMQEESTAFAMAWHGTHGQACATLVVGWQQGRTKRPLPIGGPCRAQNLRPIDKARAPSSCQVPLEVPPLVSCRLSYVVG